LLHLVQATTLSAAVQAWHSALTVLVQALLLLVTSGVVLLLVVAAHFLMACRSVVVGVSVEKLTHDRYKWRGEDISNITQISRR